MQRNILRTQTKTTRLSSKVKIRTLASVELDQLCNAVPPVPEHPLDQQGPEVAGEKSFGKRQTETTPRQSDSSRCLAEPSNSANNREGLALPKFPSSNGKWQR